MTLQTSAPVNSSFVVTSVGHSSRTPLSYSPPDLGLPAVVLIHKSQLLSECMLSSFRTADRSSRFMRYATVHDWIGNGNPEANDLVLLCLEQDDPRAIEATERDIIDLRAFDATIKIVILSDQEDPRIIIKALELGADGYVPTSASLEIVVQVLQLVKAGGRYVPATSLQSLATDSRPRQVLLPLPENNFSPRQLSVAKALRKGTPNKVIAYELNMCESTVKVHVRQIMKKLKARNRTEVAFLTNQMFSQDP